MPGTHGTFKGGYVYERDEEFHVVIEMANDDLRFGLSSLIQIDRIAYIRIAITESLESK